MTDPKQAFNSHFNLFFPSVNSFKEAKALYERTAPLRGKRAALDIRPIGSSRRQTRFQIHKISDTEYSLVGTYSNARRQVKFWGDHPGFNAEVQKGRQMVSYHKNGQIWIHTPIGMRQMWRAYHAVLKDYRLGSGQLPPTNQSWNFINQVLPAGMWVEAYGKWKRERKSYLVIPDESGPKYYLLPNTAYILKLRRYKGKWQVLNPVRERSIHIKKEVVNFSRQIKKKFAPYAHAYWDLVPQNATSESILTGLPTYLELLLTMHASPWNALVTLRRHLFHNTASHDAVMPAFYRRFPRLVYNDLASDAFDFIDVPIGQRCWPPRYAPAEPDYKYSVSFKELRERIKESQSIAS